MIWDGLPSGLWGEIDDLFTIRALIFAKCFGFRAGEGTKGVHKQIHKSIREEKGKRGEKLHTEDKQITLKQNFIKLYLALILSWQQTIRIPTEEPWLGRVLC